MSKKNNPIYEIFSKGMMNRNHKGVRFDDEGNVVIEPKAEFGADVDVDGKLTINSASDLKTKDGTGFGGSLPSPWAANEKVLGYEDTENGFVVGFLNEGGGIYGFQSTQAGVVSYVAPEIPGQPQIFVYLDVNKQIESTVVLPEDFTTKSQVIYLGDISTNKENIAKKQSTLYRHTVTFNESGLGYNNVFTAYSEKNTPIDSIQDLITVFGNTKLQCSGIIENSTTNIPCVRIDIGTTADTILFVGITGSTQKISNWYSTSPDSTLTITDSVTTM